jgi:hypothetical protein
MVEQVPVKHWVEGSSPSRGAKASFRLFKMLSLSYESTSMVYDNSKGKTKGVC